MKSLRRSFSWESIALLLNNAVGEAICVPYMLIPACLRNTSVRDRSFITSQGGGGGVGGGGFQKSGVLQN